MSEAKVIFSFGGEDVTIQCSIDVPMKDICQKFSNKINKNINSLIFLYGGTLLNFQKKFKEQANMIDKERNIIKVLVYKNENGQMICPNCGEKIKLNTEKIDEIVTSINNMKDSINSSKLLIENIINSSSMHSVNIQLKGVNIILNTLNEDINKINEKLKNLLNENKEKENKFNKELSIDKINNYIIAEIVIKEENFNKNIRIINSYEEKIRTSKYKININKMHKNEEEITKCDININGELIPFTYFYKFYSKGKYIIKYSFKNNLNCVASMFYGCSSLISIDFSNFNSNNVTNMGALFFGCSSLTSINLSNFKTNNVINMSGMFSGCLSLTSINLTHFNTNKVTDMSHMFSECSSLSSINLFNFNTTNVTDMTAMFYGCSSLINIDLSNFNSNKVTNMNFLFDRCFSLTNVNLSNFNINNVYNMQNMFGGCKNLRKENIIIKNRNILNNKQLFEEFILNIY